jgi:predicted amidohydrolase YtcJ
LSGPRKSGRSSQHGRKRRRRAASSTILRLHPTQILLNGNILTLDQTRPSAQAVAIYGDRIVAVGNNAEIQLLAGPETKLIDLREATVLPGLIDSHIHLIQYGLSLSKLDLRQVHSIEEMKSLVSSRTPLASQWILGLGWDQEKFREKRYPQRPFASLLKAGLIVAGSSDCPVEPLAPLSGIEAAVNRDGSEALSVEDAVALYTRNAAYASFEENLKGSIAPSKCADLVVLERDPRRVNPSEISEIGVLMTMVGGKIVFLSTASR